MKYKTAQLFRFCVGDTSREFNSIDVKTQRELAVARFLDTIRREFQCIFLPLDVEFIEKWNPYIENEFIDVRYMYIYMYESSNRLKDIRS